MILSSVKCVDDLFALHCAMPSVFAVDFDYRRHVPRSMARFAQRALHLRVYRNLYNGVFSVTFNTVRAQNDDPWDTVAFAIFGALLCGPGLRYAKHLLSALPRSERVFNVQTWETVVDYLLSDSAILNPLSFDSARFLCALFANDNSTLAVMIEHLLMLDAEPLESILFIRTLMREPVSVNDIYQHCVQHYKPIYCSMLRPFALVEYGRDEHNSDVGFWHMVLDDEPAYGDCAMDAHTLLQAIESHGLPAFDDTEHFDRISLWFVAQRNHHLLQCFLLSADEKMRKNRSITNWRWLRVMLVHALREHAETLPQLLDTTDRLRPWRLTRPDIVALFDDDVNAVLTHVTDIRTMAFLCVAQRDMATLIDRTQWSAEQLADEIRSVSDNHNWLKRQRCGQ